MKQILLFAAAIFTLAIHGEAEAHAFLLKSAPAVGAAVTAPSTVRLEFSEGLELAFSGIDVTNGTGALVAAKNVRFNGADHKVLLADLPPLLPGTYRVKWHAVSVDTHRTEGDFSFTVKP